MKTFDSYNLAGDEDKKIILVVLSYINISCSLIFLALKLGAI